MWNEKGTVIDTAVGEGCTTGDWIDGFGEG